MVRESAHKSDEEKLYEVTVKAITDTLKKQFTIYGNDIYKADIVTAHVYATKQVNINIILSLKKPAV